jgi:hypothetical protein
MRSSIDEAHRRDKSDWSVPDVQAREKEANLTSSTRTHPIEPLAGVATILAIVVMGVAWLADAGAVAGAAGLVAFATGAAVAGSDSRSGGDWITPPA